MLQKAVKAHIEEMNALDRSRRIDPFNRSQQRATSLSNLEVALEETLGSVDIQLLSQSNPQD